MKLFTIGESICQGFMSAAAARTDLAFSTLIAEALGASDYRYPTWPKGGHPLNVEWLLRRLENLAGPNVNVLEWPLVLMRTASYMDTVEDYYEREEGRASAPDPSGHDFFHTVAARGFDIADAWQVDPKLCRDEIDKETKIFFNDGFFALPSASFYRTALNVLNPSRQRSLNGRTALGWLEHHHTGDEDPAGVENLILWLGSNNALGTVLDLEIIATDDPDSAYHPDMEHGQRQPFNLWSPDHFELDYRHLMDEVHRIMTSRDNDWHVFVGNVPAVTIAPLAKGVGASVPAADPFEVLEGKAQYFEYYTYFLFDVDTARDTDFRLTFDEAYKIDTYIAAYNKIIKNSIDDKNALLDTERYHLVDINAALVKAAYKRNFGKPIYPFPDGMAQRPYHVDTRFYHATREGKLVEGGLFSLDGVHPSAIGQGLLAHEFMGVMNAARGLDLSVDWDAVYRSDDLYSKPLRMMPWVHTLDDLAELFLNFTSSFGRRPGVRTPRPPRDR